MEQTKNHRRISLLRIHDQASKNFGEREGSAFNTKSPVWEMSAQWNCAKVVDFYHSPDVSRQMPGLKDYVSLKGVGGSRERKQKFLILSNLKEAYQNFKEKHQTMKIGFSKFAEFCPKECVLPGSSGTHSLCVCTKHNNNIPRLSPYTKEG